MEYQTTFHFNSFFAVKGAIYHAAIATVIFSHVKTTCYFHVWRYCWPAGKASIKGTTAFENTTLYSQSTCSHLRFTHTIRPTRNTADPYDTTTELSAINNIMFSGETSPGISSGVYTINTVELSLTFWILLNFKWRRGVHLLKKNFCKKLF